MSLQLRFGIAGAALGLVIGIVGCLIAAAPFPVFLWKPLLATVICGILGIALHAVLNAFLPELLQEPSGGTGDDLSDAPEHSVNITLPEEGFPADTIYGDDQAAPLRQAAAARYDDGFNREGGADAEEADDGMIEEVSEDRRSRPIGSDAAGDTSFNEAAFYDGVDRLPDIGGFSEQFQPGDGSGENEGAAAPDTEDSRSPGGSRSKKGSGTNMDPNLIAQAIRTALKKDNL